MRRLSTLILIFALLLLSVFAVIPSKAQSAWQPGVAYSVGTLVTYAGHTYKCIQAHTSQVGWEPSTTAALWQDMGVTTGGSTNTPTFVPTITNTPVGPTATKTNTPVATTNTGNGNPFSGSPYSVPGKVEAENFNTGGEGVAYHDAEATNQGGQYRTADGVDIEASTDTGAGYNVGWTATGEWEKYTVNVTTAGTYSIDFRVASAQAGSGLHLEIDGNNVTGTLTVPNTGGWQTWTTITKTGVSFSAGQHVLRLFIDVGGMNFNWFNVYGGSVTNTPTTTTLPDLTITSLTYSPSVIACQNQPGTNVTVANSGNANAGAFVVNLNGSTLNVSSLAAGQSTTLRFSIAPGSASATADSTNVIVESNENNNTLTASLPVPTQAPACTATGGTNGNPFSGSPYSVPGKVEAENFNTGGEGVAYHDAEATNQGGQYRTADGVDIEASTDTGAGYNVGWTATGEWEKYTVNVTTAGTYSIDFRVASAQAGSGLHLEIDGNNVTGTLTVPNTGGWQTWTTITKTGVSFSAGQHVLRLFIDVGGMNFNWFNVYTGGSVTNTPTPLPNGWTGRYFAPYVDVTLIQGSLSSMVSGSGGKFVTLAFINNGSSCSAQWAGGSSMTSGFLSSDITTIRNAGGDAMPSFGGYNANELADNCPDPTTLQGQYQAVINAYHFTHLDFDIENGPNFANLDNTTAIDRRNKALAALQQANAGLFITFTLPASPSGLQQNGINLLNNAVSNGVNVGAVNIMVMDYGTSGTEMGTAATSAGTALKGQLASIFTGKSTAQLWQMVGLTPMIGQNDSPGEIFTLGDASTVLSYAQSNNIRELAFWSLARDNGGCAGSTSASSTCSGVSQSSYQFSSIMKPFTQ